MHVFNETTISKKLKVALVLLVTSTFCVILLDTDLSYNVLVEHLFNKVDEDGNQYQLFKDIVNHRKNKSAMDKRLTKISSGQQERQAD
jgi:hypothetical protein